MSHHEERQFCDQIATEERWKSSPGCYQLTWASRATFLGRERPCTRLCGKVRSRDVVQYGGLTLTAMAKAIWPVTEVNTAPSSCIRLLPIASGKSTSGETTSLGGSLARTSPSMALRMTKFTLAIGIGLGAHSSR